VGSNVKGYAIFFSPMLVAVRLATNYEKISRQGTATVLVSKHINRTAIDKPLIGMEIYFKLKDEIFFIISR
jgi:hypothetical protein